MSNHLPIRSCRLQIKTTLVHFTKKKEKKDTYMCNMDHSEKTGGNDFSTIPRLQDSLIYHCRKVLQTTIGKLEQHEYWTLLEKIA